MTRGFIFFVLLMTAFQAVAQKDSIRKYLDADLRFTSKKNAVYAAMALKRDDHWLLYAVYPDTSTLLTINYKDANLTIQDGPYALYHPKRVPAQKGFFKDNLPHGRWQSWYSNGHQKNEGLIVNNHLSGLWKAWYEDGSPMSEQTFADYVEPAGTHEHSPAKKVEAALDDFAPSGVLEGTTTNWYRNGKKESVLQYHNDSLAGVCSWYRENGSMSSKETYVNGQVIELACYDSSGNFSGNTCSILKMPLLIHPFFTALDYIEYELHKEKRRGIEEGEVGLSFMVTKNGKVEQITFEEGPEVNLQRLIVKIFETMPRWSPAVSHNRPIDYRMKMTVPYYKD